MFWDPSNFHLQTIALGGRCCKRAHVIKTWAQATQLTWSDACQDTCRQYVFQIRSYLKSNNCSDWQIYRIVSCLVWCCSILYHVTFLVTIAVLITDAGKYRCPLLFFNSNKITLFIFKSSLTCLSLGQTTTADLCLFHWMKRINGVEKLIN